MSQVAYNVITVASLALSLIYVASAPTTLKSTLKIVNSTNIRELKHNFAAEDKSGGVAYVYPVGTDENAQSSWTASVSLPKTEAERMAAPKKHSSQVKDASLKSTVTTTAKAGKDYPDTSGSSDPSTKKLKEKMDTSATTKIETRPETESQNNTSLYRSSTAQSLSKTERNQTITNDNGKPDCIIRVMPAAADDDKLVVYNSTREEAEAMGLEVFDTVCEGDDDWDKVISAGALASLCCGSG